jgi:hypothetical protein
MTFTNQTSVTSAVGTGVAGQEIPFSFPAGSSNEIEVKTKVVSTGIPTTLIETTDYTVTLSGDSGGTVTLVSALATTSHVFVMRSTANTQGLDLEHGGTFSAENIEDSFDKLTKLIINLQTKVDRAMLVPDTDPLTQDLALPSSVDRAGYIQGYNSVDGSPELFEVDNITPAVLSTSFKLLSSTTVSFAADGDTTIYTVPANARLVIDHLVVIAKDTAGATTTLSCGQNGAETDFVPAHTLSNLDDLYDVVEIRPAISTTPTKLKSYAAGTVIEVSVASNSGVAGNVVLMYGTIYSDPSWTTSTSSSTTTSSTSSTSSSTTSSSSSSSSSTTTSP